MFLKGLILGFSVAAPVGPIGLLCIQRSLRRGRLHGFVSGLGAASADTVYCVLAALGLTAITSFLLSLQIWLHLGGGLLLLWLGLRTLRVPPPTTVAGPADGAGLVGAYLSIFLLTLASPATIVLFFAVFAGLGIDPAAGAGAGAGLLLTAGVFLGSATWWLLLSALAGLLRGHLTDGRMRAINRVAGFCLLALAFWSLGQVATAKLL